MHGAQQQRAKHYAAEKRAAAAAEHQQAVAAHLLRASAPRQQARALLELGRHAWIVRQPKCAFLADHKRGFKSPGWQPPRTPPLTLDMGAAGQGL